MRIKRLVTSLVVALPVLVGCRADEKLSPPALLDARFQRYVALGNSITAGYQSAGINDSTQQRSYAVLLSQAMGTPFVRPSLQGRGCAPPLTNNVTQARVGGGTSSTCDLRTPTSVPNNLAVPGARVEELLNNFGTPVSTSNALTTFILGGKTQIERMAELQPTFVTAWAGNNDVLGALTSASNPGNPAFITPAAAFARQYDSLANAIAATGASAALIGVVDVTAIPFASSGTIYWCLKNAPACGFSPPAPLPATFTVNNNCSPAAVGLSGVGDSTLVPWTKGIPRVLAASLGASTDLDCSQDTVVVTPSEYAALRQAAAAYNNHIDSVATAHGWAFANPNSLLGILIGAGQIPLFPDLSAVATGGSVSFGPYISLDGVHPSSAGHRAIADALAQTINSTYGTSLPVPICSTVTCPAP